MAHRTEIMWIERKIDGLVGPARIGRVTYSNSGRSLSYGEQRFESLKRKGFKANYADLATGEQYWISGCHKDGKDALYSTTAEIDDDVRREYWAKIRNQPENSHISRLHVPGKYPG
jgi:hypothetical protein